MGKKLKKKIKSLQHENQSLRNELIPQDNSKATDSKNCQPNGGILEDNAKQLKTKDCKKELTLGLLFLRGLTALGFILTWFLAIKTCVISQPAITHVVFFTSFVLTLLAIITTYKIIDFIIDSGLNLNPPFMIFIFAFVLFAYTLLGYTLVAYGKISMRDYFLNNGEVVVGSLVAMLSIGYLFLFMYGLGEFDEKK